MNHLPKGSITFEYNCSNCGEGVIRTFPLQQIPEVYKYIGADAYQLQTLITNKEGQRFCQACKNAIGDALAARRVKKFLGLF